MYVHQSYHQHVRTTMVVPNRPLVLFLLFVLIVSLYPFAAYQHDVAAPTLPLSLSHPLPAQPAPLPLPALPPTTASTVDLTSLPLSFEPYRGQYNSVAAFRARGFGGTVFFLSNEVVLSLPMAQTANTHQAVATDDTTVVSIQYLGTMPDVAVKGAETDGGMVNYLYGADPSQWKTNIPTYRGIVYQNLYAGIVLRYDGTGGMLKGTYTVAANANPSLIRWSYNGAADVSLNSATGGLNITLPDGTSLVEHAPIAWQDVAGTRTTVPVAYDMQRNGTIGFTLGDYNPAYALTIDPALMYSTYLGGSNPEEGNGIAVFEETIDGVTTQYIYVTGSTQSQGLQLINPLPGEFGKRKVANNQDLDIFVTKVRRDVQQDKSSTVYNTYIGGIKQDIGLAIDVDSKGFAYITGSTESSVLASELDAVRDGAIPSDAFKQSFPISPTHYITVDNELRLDPMNVAYDYQLGGSKDAFVAKIVPDGSDLVYSTFLGGSNAEEGRDIRVHTSKNGDFYQGQELEYAYVVGQTTSDDFPLMHALPDGNVYADSDKVNGGDGFLTKLDPYGKSLQYSTYLGGTNVDVIHGIAVQELDNPATNEPFVYVTGETESPDLFTDIVSPTLQANHQGGYDAFIAKVTRNIGENLYYVVNSYLGGPDNDYGTDIAVDSHGNMYVAGYTQSANFPGVNEKSYQSTINGNGSTAKTDAFVSKINANGQSIAFSTYLGGEEDDKANGIAIDKEVDTDGNPAPNIYLTGETVSGAAPDGGFPTLASVPQPQTPGAKDAFVVKLNAHGKLTEDPAVIQADSTSQYYSTLIGGTGNDVANDIAVYGSGDDAYTVIVGTTGSNSGFYITSDQAIRAIPASGDAFIVRVGAPTLFANEGARSLQEGGSLSIPINLNAPSSTDTFITVNTKSCDNVTDVAIGGTAPGTGNKDGEPDYRSYDNERLVIPAGLTQLSGSTGITVEVFPDIVDETNEMFCVEMSTGFGETKVFSITIADDDGPAVQFTKQAFDAIKEPQTGVLTAAFTVELQPKIIATSRQTVEVPIAFASLGKGMYDGIRVATSGDDYDALDVSNSNNFVPSEADGDMVLQFPAHASGNQLRKQVYVRVNADTIKERTEIFGLDMTQGTLKGDPMYKDSNGKPLLRATYGDILTATMTIQDGYDTKTKAHLGFVETTQTAPVSYTVREKGHNIFEPFEDMVNVVQVQVIPQYGTPSSFGEPVKINLQAGTGGTADETADYRFQNPYTLLPGQVGTYTLPISITADSEIELHEQVPLYITIVDGTDLVDTASGAASNATLVIENDDESEIYLPMVMISIERWYQ